MSDLLFPVYEFRPLPSAFGRQWDDEVFRFADGQWIPDDGEYDLAFVQGNVCLMVELPYQRNILWSWTTGHWSAFESRHSGGNAWHYMLRDGEKAWGGNWGRDLHPNTKAARSGMNWACGKHRCSNGRHVQFHLNDPHITAGFLRERDSQRVVTVPETPCCMYCGDGYAAQEARP